MTTLDETGTAVDGISKMLATILPPDIGFVLVTFSVAGGVTVRVTRSTNHGLAMSVRKLGEAIVEIERKANAA